MSSTRQILDLKLILFFLSMQLIVSSCKSESGPGAKKNAQRAGQPVAADFDPGVQQRQANQIPSIIHNGYPLQPVILDLKGIKNSNEDYKDWLPEGATIDKSSERLYWLPKLGQVGKYAGVVNLNGRYQNVVLEIANADFNKGPAKNYRDGDVGYILVHGKGVNYCEDQDALDDYWRASKKTIAPDSKYLKVVCYDGTKAVADTAAGVAEQIKEANCGRFNKCIVITHSMGGLLMEHMLIHTRKKRDSDPEPTYFDNKLLYKEAKDRVLFVVSIASAAGGSKASELLLDPDSQSLIQSLIGKISGFFEDKNDAAENLLVLKASTIVAPITEDPGVPFFMVPGFSKELVDALGDVLGTSSENPFDVFNDDREIAALDRAVEYSSRSDGLVSFRSACGIADSDVDAGPGWDADLERQFEYCFEAPKKPNHFVWFLSNLNHSQNRWATSACAEGGNECEVYMPNFSDKTYERNINAGSRSVTMAIRDLLIGRIK